MNLREVLKKQGGIDFVRQLLESRTLITAIGEFVLLGKEKKALEILRLAIQYKTKKNLEKKYKYQIQMFDKNLNDELEHKQSNKVWVCWFQGMDQAPPIVKRCFQSLEENLKDKEIILITKENMDEYVKFPDYIIEKWEKGQITNTHMTDLLRLELLINYGGMWIDSTVMCTRETKDIPDYYFNSDLFLYQTLKPGRDGQAQLISSWLISAKTHNRILIMTRELCYEYWKKNTRLQDYFLFHDFFSIALEHNRKDWNAIIPKDNASSHIILLRLFEQYDEKIWNAAMEQTPFHKLTYKFDKEQAAQENTFYKKIITKYED